MKKYFFFFLLSAFLFPQCNSAQTVEAELFYLTRTAKVNVENPPLLILLHGLGSNENDLFGIAPLLPDSFLVISVRAPRTIRQGSYRWYDLQWIDEQPIGNKDELLESRNMLIRFIEKLDTKLSFDKNKIYLGGFSQGAIMSFSVALKRPELLKGIVLLSGKIPDSAEVLTENEKQYKKLKVLLIHGTEDKVLSIEGARESKNLLDKIGAETQYHELKMPHTLNQEVLDILKKWLYQ